MNSNIQFFTEDISYTLKQKTELRQWIKACAEVETREAGNINIILCSDVYLYKMNVEYLNHDTFTDIITFDNTMEGEISGDLFISLERIRENAREYSRKMSDELHRVIIHGILHLCSYSDKTDEEKKKMRARENIHLSRRSDKLSNS